MSNEIADRLGAEVAAISLVRDALKGLDPDQSSRVLAYVASALSLATQKTEPQLAQRAAESSSEQVGATNVDSRRTFAMKRPSSDIERVLVLAYCVTLRGESSFDSARLVSERLAAAAPPFDIIEAAKSAVKKGYFAAAGQRKRQLTVLGEEVADALPDREAVRSLLHEVGRRAAAPRKRVN